MKVKSLSRVRLLGTPWTAAYQAPPSMGFSRQEYWSGVPLPSLHYNICHAKVFISKIEKNIPLIMVVKNQPEDFPGGPMVKNPPANAGDLGSIPE